MRSKNLIIPHTSLLTPHYFMPSAIFLMGPTASGKSELAIELATRLPCEIISVDSAMVYRGMDIGTAKPARALLSRIPHHLIDIRDPSESYSAAQFRHDALREMARISAAGKVPLLVGGTLLYFRALERGLSELPPADAQVRAALEAEAAQHGWRALHAQLAEVDPQAARRIHPNDPQRIQRALEIYRLSGHTATELYARPTAQELPYRLTKLVVAPGDRDVLHRRIVERFHAMLAQGLVDEVAALRRSGELTLQNPALRAVGYRQVWHYLEGKMDCDTMIKSAIIATRQFAKRQFTWLRVERDAVWLDSLDTGLFATVARLCADTLGHAER